MTSLSSQGLPIAPTKPPLEFREAWFSYDGQVVVEDASFVVSAGEFVAILGPNGSGKTTLLRMALGLLKPTHGDVLLFGTRADRFHDWEKIGYVPQRVEGLETRFPATVAEVVAQGRYFGFDPLRLFRRGDRKRVDEALETVGIPSLRDRRVSSLSVGQQQRMLIARALVRRPAVMFMDEPVAGVDAAGREQFHSLIRHLNQDLGITIVLVSHDIGAVMREATTCACINRQLMFHGPVHQLTSEALARLYGFPVDVMLHDAEHTHR